MNGEFHYREKWPKELRLTVENEDEFNLLRLIFTDSPRGILRRYKADELSVIEKDDSWKKTMIKKSDLAEEDGAYSTYGVYEALEEEQQNMQILEDASHI